ncbi:MAG TPA: biotin/lipoyl-containing protein, partial [Gammaproteobacteria bacterium]|nr:biotin/lipoyl-containing protein [Gammaproteobacteria bacterium]
MKTFNLPDLGEGLQEAEIVNWHVKEGDTVKVDQPLLSVETAKAVVDVPSPWAGKIAKLYGKNGDIIPTHSALVDFDIEGGAAAPASAKKEEAAAQKAAPDAKKGTPVAEDSGTVVGNVPTSNAVVAETAIIRKKQKQEPQRVKALPSVRILAKQMGVDLSGIPPTGKNDTVTADDVRNAAGGRSAAAPASAPQARWDIQPKRSDVKYGVAEPLRGPRRAMHASMTKSRSEVAECTLFDDADIHNWMPGQDITVRIVRAIVAGCRAEPELNAWYDGEKLERTIH